MSYSKEQLDLVLEDIEYTGIRADANYDALKSVLYGLERRYAKKHELYITHVVYGISQGAIAKQNNVTPQSISHHVMFYREKLRSEKSMNQIKKGITSFYDEKHEEFCPDMADIKSFPLILDMHLIDRLVDDCFKDFDFVAMDYVVLTIILDNIKMTHYKEVNIYQRYLLHMKLYSELGIEFGLSDGEVIDSIDGVRTFIRMYYNNFAKDLYIPMGSIVHSKFIYNLCKNAGYPVTYIGDEVAGLIGLDLNVLSISSSTYNALGRSGITTVEQLESYLKETPMRPIRGIGPVRMKEIREAYSKYMKGDSDES